ncbi:hypothetical protein HMPREF9374_2093 [Desmospora sp. 8437]|nr:hypothetical protein HMPREF9374_2093 [Desmospora sp. 8437]
MPAFLCFPAFLQIEKIDDKPLTPKRIGSIIRTEGYSLPTLCLPSLPAVKK